MGQICVDKKQNADYTAIVLLSLFFSRLPGTKNEAKSGWNVGKKIGINLGYGSKQQVCAYNAVRWEAF